MEYIFITGTRNMNVIMIARIKTGEWNGVWRLGPGLQDYHSGGEEPLHETPKRVKYDILRCNEFLTLRADCGELWMK